MITQIGIGSAPNDGTGQTLRDAFARVNANYNWLTGKIGTSDTQIVLAADIPVRYLDMTASTGIFEDVQYPIVALNPPGLPSPPTDVFNSGQGGDQFAAVYTNNNVLIVVSQTPHWWLPGTIVYPHLHIQPQTTTPIATSWNLKYSIADDSGVFPASTSINFASNIAGNNQWKSLLLPLPPTGLNLAGFTGPSVLLRLFYTMNGVPSEPIHAIGFDVHMRYGGTAIHYTPP